MNVHACTGKRHAYATRPERRAVQVAVGTATTSTMKPANALRMCAHVKVILAVLREARAAALMVLTCAHHARMDFTSMTGCSVWPIGVVAATGHQRRAASAFMMAWNYAAHVA